MAYMNILTWTILKKTQILNGCETFAFKYILLEGLNQFRGANFHEVKHGRNPLFYFNVKMLDC